MPVCPGCGKKYLMGKSCSNIKLCQTCWKNIEADKWVSLCFATKEDLENEKNRIVSLATNLNFSESVIKEISSYFESELDAGFTGYADGGLSQSIRIYKDHCFVSTSENFPQGKMMQPYIKEGGKILAAADKKRETALNEKQRRREEQVKQQTSNEITNDILKHPGRIINTAIKMGMGFDADGSLLTRNLEKKYDSNMKRSERNSFFSDLSDQFSDVTIKANDSGKIKSYADSASGFTTSADMKKATISNVNVQNDLNVSVLDSSSDVLVKAYGIKKGKNEIEYRNLKSLEYVFPEVEQGRFKKNEKAGYIRFIFENGSSTAFFFDGNLRSNSADVKSIYLYIKGHKDVSKLSYEKKQIEWEIGEYKALLNENIISSEEFQNKKNQLDAKLANLLSESEKHKVRFCQFCGQPLEENAEYCIHCGRKVIS